MALMSAAVLLFATACDDDDNTPNPPTPPTDNLVTDIRLTPSTLELVQEESAQLKAEFTPADASNLGEVDWQVRNPNIASVTPDGTVTGKEPGNTVVICKVGKVEATCEVTVTEKQMEKADFEVELVEINAGQVKFSIKPKDKECNWFCDVMPLSTFNCDNIGGEKGVAAKDREWWEMVTGSKNPADWISLFGYKGDLQYDSRDGENGSGIASLFWGMDYILYIYGMDENAMPTTEIMQVKFKTPHQKDSQNQISIEIIETYQENIHAKITTTNNDPWFFIIESKKYWDAKMEAPEYVELGAEESFAADMVIRNLDIPFLFNSGDLEITPETPILPPTLRPDRDYVLIVFGYEIEKGSTTPIYHKEFKTQPRQ